MDGAISWDQKLFYSTINGDIDGVMAALAQGARVTVRDTKGCTPLLGAAQNGHVEICGLLLAHGSNVNEVQPDTKDTHMLCYIETEI